MDIKQTPFFDEQEYEKWNSSIDPIPSGAGIKEILEKEPYFSDKPMTQDDLISAMELFAKAEKYHRNQPIQLDVVYLIQSPDELFSYYFNSDRYAVIAGRKLINRIYKRAFDLKLINEYIEI